MLYQTLRVAVSQMSSRALRTFCELSTDCERLLEGAMTQQRLSACTHDRILKVARTVADIEEQANIEPTAHRRSNSVSELGPDISGRSAAEGCVEQSGRKLHAKADLAKSLMQSEILIVPKQTTKTR
jgi:hypothetical protein